MKININKLLSSYISIALLLVLLITSVDVCCFNTRFYKEELISNDSANKVMMSESDTYQAMIVLLDYLHNDIESIDLELPINNEIKEVYTLREKQHMVDVANLYHNVLNLRIVLILSSVILLVYLFKNKSMFKENLLCLCYQFIRVALCFLIVMVFIGGWAYVDFDAFWINFHKLLFRNDLWLLDPNNSIMINILEESVFFKLVFRVVISFGIMFVALFACALYKVKKHHYIG
ncbi:MAG: DUF1461 domain-containing protein [Erysipelotrichaceae bacterium]